MKSIVPFLLSFAFWFTAIASPPLTVLRLEEARTVFDRIASLEEIPFSYPDGCFAKAQKIAMILEAEGIITGKAFVEGNLFYVAPNWVESFWTYHVAPIILVAGPDGNHPYVVDPFLASRLLTHGEWLSLVGKDRRTTIKKAYFTERFVYDPTQRELNPTEYNPVLVRDMEIVFEQIRRRLRDRGRN